MSEGFGRNRSTELQRPVIAAGSAIFFFLLGGATFYHFAEGWSWIDSVYFCSSAMTTVGLGDITPTKEWTRMFTSFYLISGTGVVVTSVGVIGSRFLERRDRKVFKRMNKMQERRGDAMKDDEHFMT